MNTENSPKPAGKVKVFIITGIICGMGGYICGDKIDEIDKREQDRRPYAIADSLLEQAARKQDKWLEIQEQLQSTLTFHKITIDSLERITDQLENYRYALESKNQELKQCEESKEALQKEKDGNLLAYENEQQEVKIRDNQLDSLENLAKSYIKENSDLQEAYKYRSPVESEFQAIHNCINAQGHSMSSYEFGRQVKCCIEKLKKLQKKYPKDEFENIALNCNAD